jgi:hypothetical protein
MTKYSKIDWWLALIICSSIAAPLVWGIKEVMESKPNAWYLILTALFLTGLLTLGLPCKYTMNEKSLVIKAGILVNEIINFSDIISATKSMSPNSAPALSLRRIAIKTKNDTYLISPSYRDEFILELKERIKGKKKTKGKRKKKGKRV